jgi:hypothetical protein
MHYDSGANLRREPLPQGTVNEIAGQIPDEKLRPRTAEKEVSEMIHELQCGTSRRALKAWTMEEDPVGRRPPRGSGWPRSPARAPLFTFAYLRNVQTPE